MKRVTAKLKEGKAPESEDVLDHVNNGQVLDLWPSGTRWGTKGPKLTW